MNGKELFQAHAKEWLHARGFTEDIDRLDAAVSRAKLQIIRDVRTGRVPPEVATFSELHDYVDANEYGDACEWPAFASETDDEGYQVAMMEFWNSAQDQLDDWITSGEMRRSLQKGPSAGRR